MGVNSGMPLKVTPIIKVVGDFCNLRCGYCFYSCNNQNTPRKLSDVLLDRFLEEYFSLFDGNCLFIWHGGEPLLAELSFFQRVVDLQRQYKTKAHSCIKNWDIGKNGLPEMRVAGDV